MMSSITAAKLAVTLSKAGTAGYITYKTAMHNSLVLLAVTGMGIALNATTKEQVFTNAVTEGFKAGFAAIKTGGKMELITRKRVVSEREVI